MATVSVVFPRPPARKRLPSHRPGSRYVRRYSLPPIERCNTGVSDITWNSSEPGFDSAEKFTGRQTAKSRACDAHFKDEQTKFERKTEFQPNKQHPKKVMKRGSHLLL